MLAALLICSSGGFTACGGSKDQTGSASGPLYIGATRVWTADSSQGYLFTVSSLDKGTEVDLKKAVEIDDAWVFGKGDPYFYTATLFSPTITRWTLSPKGGFEKDTVVSFVNYGVEGTHNAAFTPIFSKEKAYFVDSTSAQVVVWNPATMEFLRTIPLPAKAAGEFATYTPILGLSQRQDRIFVTIFWADPDSWWTKYAPSSRLVTIDPQTDTVVEVHDEDRCETMSPAGTTADGTSYFGPWDYHATVRAVFGEGFGAKSCALRVVPSGMTYDEGYQVDLSSLVGGRPAGGLTLLDDQYALIHVWHSELVAATPENWKETRFEPAYTWYRWKLGEATATELPNQMPSSEGGEWLRLDGAPYTYNPNADYSKTTLFELNSSGELKEHLTLPGWTAQLIRVR